MMNKLILAILLTFAPAFELRAGIPMAIVYAQENTLPLLPIIMLIILINILLIFLIYSFLDYFHHKLIEIKWYRKSFEFYFKRIQKKIDKVEAKTGLWTFVALALFVAIPLPGTGAYTGAFIAWFLGIEKKKSIISIAIGIIIAGILVSLATLGVLKIIGL